MELPLAGESLRAAAVRETWEEAGVEVELKGLLHLEAVDTSKYGPWRRIIFYAEPTAETRSSGAAAGGTEGTPPEGCPTKVQDARASRNSLWPRCKTSSHSGMKWHVT